MCGTLLHLSSKEGVTYGVFRLFFFSVLVSVIISTCGSSKLDFVFVLKM